MKQVTALVVGGGQRGKTYAKYAADFPDRFKIVGVVSRSKFNQEQIQKPHNISDDKVFKSWEEAAALEKFADVVIISTPDDLHKEPAIAFMRKGYHILLEKPMALTLKECEDIVEECKKNNVILAVCHVLRYAIQSVKIYELIQSGVIGDLVNIQLLEPVGYWHFSHAFVRGQWNQTAKDSSVLLMKSCHDIDLLLYWFKDKKVKNISSFGSLYHFKKENKPKGAGSRCLECAVERDCAYSAKKIYIDNFNPKEDKNKFPWTAVTNVPDIESLTDGIKSGPFGRCVYECDNDVNDNQVVNIQFEDGATASFSMSAFTEKLCARQVRVFGTKGELTCDYDTKEIRHFKFNDSSVEIIKLQDSTDAENSQLTYHGGSDFYLMKAFVNAVANNDPSLVTTGVDETLLSHKLCFLAEQARKENRVVLV